MRYTVTGELDPELFAEVERERHAAGLSRSAAIRQALEWWVHQRKEHGEERVGRAEGRHRQVMRRLEYIVGMIREQERAAGQNQLSPSGSLAKVSENGSVDEVGNGYARVPGRGLLEAKDEEGCSPGGQPARSALEQARERARRKVE